MERVSQGARLRARQRQTESSMGAGEQPGQDTGWRQCLAHVRAKGQGRARARWHGPSLPERGAGPSRADAGLPRLPARPHRRLRHKAGAGGGCGQGWGLAGPVGCPAGHGPGRAGGDCPGSQRGRPAGPVDPGQPEEAGRPCGCCQPTLTEELTQHGSQRSGCCSPALVPRRCRGLSCPTAEDAWLGSMPASARCFP